MVSTIRHITFGCRNSYALSKFWEQVTGFSEDPDDPNEPEHAENLIRPSDGSAGILFVNWDEFPDPKSLKNRVHLDLGPDTTRDEEVERLLGIGATLIADHRTPEGRGWVTLGDPEGNEFCIERSDSERAADASETEPPETV